MPRPRKDQRLADDLRAHITSGIYRSGERLPSVRELCPEFGVSRGTIQKALAILREDGLVESRRGSGWYVVKRASDTNTPIADTHLLMSINFGDLDKTYASVMIFQLIEQYVAQHGRRFVHQRDNQPVDSASFIRQVRQCPEPHILVYDGLMRNLLPRNDFWVLLGELPKRIVAFSFDLAPQMSPLDTVVVDWLCGTEAAVQSLVQRGCRHLLFAGYDGVNWSDVRRGGFLRALRHHALWEFGLEQPCLPVPVAFPPRPSLDDARVVAQHLISYLKEHKVDGVVCVHDRILEAAVELAEAEHLTLPAMIGHDNSIWAAEHGYSSVCMNARLFVDEMFRLLSLPPAPHPRVVSVPTMLIER